MSEWNEKLERVAQRHIAHVIQDTISESLSRGYLECSLCEFRAHGSDGGEMLDALGAHGMAAHMARRENAAPVEPRSR